MNKTEIAQTIFRAQGTPPHGLQVNLSEDTILDPETQQPVTIYYLLFKNSAYQKLAENRQRLVDVSRWLKATHDAMRSVGLRVIIQPIFDGYDGLTPDQLQYKLQEIINKK